jgi:hypothetical protein
VSQWIFITDNTTPLYDKEIVLVPQIMSSSVCTGGGGGGLSRHRHAGDKGERKYRFILDLGTR